MTFYAADLCFSSSSFFVHATSILVRKRTRTVFHTRLPYILSILYHTQAGKVDGYLYRLYIILILVHLNYTILIHYFSRFPFPSSDRHRPLLKLSSPDAARALSAHNLRPFSLSGRRAPVRPYIAMYLLPLAGTHTHTQPHPPHNPDILE